MPQAEVVLPHSPLEVDTKEQTQVIRMPETTVS